MRLSLLGLTVAAMLISCPVWAQQDALVAGNPTPSLRVPEPPQLPKPTLGGLLVNGLLNGVPEYMQISSAERRYRAELKEFLSGLTPEESSAIEADPQQVATLQRALAYFREADQRLAVIAESNRQTAPAQGVTGPGTADGVTVYNPSECIGAVVNGVCHGSVLPNAAYHPVCHGEVLNGVCTGPMF